MNANLNVTRFDHIRANLYLKTTTTLAHKQLVMHGLTIHTVYVQSVALIYNRIAKFITSSKI